MESATITKVTLRQEKLRSGKLSLYLDFYPPIWNPHIKNCLLYTSDAADEL